MSTDSAARRAFRSKVDSIRPTFGFEDVSLAPGTDTVDPADVDLSAEIGGIGLPIPVLAAAMDAVVDARFAGALAALGGLAVLNLEGVQARFDDPDFVLERIATAPDADLGDVLAEAYGTPLREDLVARRIAEVRATGSRVAIASTPVRATEPPANDRSRRKTSRIPVTGAVPIATASEGGGTSGAVPVMIRAKPRPIMRRASPTNMYVGLANTSPASRSPRRFPIVMSAIEAIAISIR